MDLQSRKKETLDYISTHCGSLVFGQWMNKGEVNVTCFKQTNDETFETRKWNKFTQKRREKDCTTMVAVVRLKLEDS